MIDDERLALIAKALAHPARVALIRTLANTPSCCGHLVRELSSAELPLAQSTVSQHLRVLADAGLVSRTSCGVENVYNLNEEMLTIAAQAIASLLTTSPTQVPSATPASPDRLEKA